LLWEQDVGGSNPLTPTTFVWSRTTLYAIVTGALLGLSGIGTGAALFALAAALSVKVLVDVKWERLPLLGWPSPYAVYCHNLAQRGEATDHAWVSYVIQLFAFGLLGGWAAYALLRLLT
jgi:hypothetical protein